MAKSTWDKQLPKRISKDRVAAWVKLDPATKTEDSLRAVLVFSGLLLSTTSGLRKGFNSALDMVRPEIVAAIQASGESASDKAGLIETVNLYFADLVKAGPMPMPYQARANIKRLEASGTIPVVSDDDTDAASPEVESDL